MIRTQVTRTISTEQDMLALGAKLAAIIEKGTIIFLHGTLGAGKTTLVRGFLRGLGCQDKIKSPTYTLVEPYEVGNKHINHFDLYRLNTASELEQIGIEDYFSASAICFVEWPEKGYPLLPKPDLACYILEVNKKREVRIESHSTCGDYLVTQL